MKDSTRAVRASHVNSGTSVPKGQLPWPRTWGPVMRMPKLHAEVVQGAPVTAYGGLAVVEQFLRRFQVAQALNQSVHVLQIYLPYTEADHVLAQALNLYAGGTCLEDMTSIQHDEAVKRMFGACRFPDPTTAGDFLRRFDEQLHPGSLEGLRAAIDKVARQVWKRLGRKLGRRIDRKRWAVVHLDGHIKALYGEQKQGADFAYNGQWSYNTLTATLGGVGECLAVRLRPGNMRSSQGAAELVEQLLPTLLQQFDRVLVVADSDFDRADLRAACHRRNVYFAFVGRSNSARPSMANQIERWWPFRTRQSRERTAQQTRKGYKPRTRRTSRRTQRALERGYTNMTLVGQHIGQRWSIDPQTKNLLRLVVRRQQIARYESRQGNLFEQWRERYVVTNLPVSWSAEQVIDETYCRCDQENVIEQLGSGLAMWRMPVKQFAGNEAWIEIARLAWNLRVWIAQLVLPEEVVRWEWKRFRHAFVYIAAQVVRLGRQLWVRFFGSHRFVRELEGAHARL